ncbi:amidase family protein, partial [Burkholderia cepacia]
MTNNLCELTTHELSALYENGEVSPVDVMRDVLDRIQSLDPAVNAVCEITDTALSMAEASEARWRRGISLGPLDGVPITIKDNVSIAGVATRFGSRVTGSEAS